MGKYAGMAMFRLAQRKLNGCCLAVSISASRHPGPARGFLRRFPLTLRPFRNGTTRADAALSLMYPKTHTGAWRLNHKKETHK